MAAPWIEQYQRAVDGVAAFDLSSFGKLVLRGKDAGTFLQNFTTNDVIKPGPGHGCETFVLTAQAKVVAWPRALIGENEIYLHTEPGLTPRLLQHLERHQIAEQVEFEDRTEADDLWHLCGPSLAESLQTWGLDFSALRPWQHVALETEGLRLRLQRSDFLALPGLFVFAGREHRDRVVNVLSQLRVPIIPHDSPAWTALRVEAGTPACGTDFDETNLPQEVNRTDPAISFTKGCYLGQETVARIRAYGHVNRMLQAVKFPTRTSDEGFEISSWHGVPLRHGDKEVGRVKSISYSPRLGCWLSFGLVRREHWDVGHSLDAVHASGEVARVEITTWPRSAGG